MLSKVKGRGSQGSDAGSVLWVLLLTMWALAALSQCVPSYQTGGGTQLYIGVALSSSGVY